MLAEHGVPIVEADCSNTKDRYMVAFETPESNDPGAYRAAMQNMYETFKATAEVAGSSIALTGVTALDFEGRNAVAVTAIYVPKLQACM